MLRQFLQVDRECSVVIVMLDQVLSFEPVSDRGTEAVMHCSLSQRHLLVEAVAVVVNQIPLRVSHVSLSKLDILLTSLLYRLISSLVSQVVVELLSPVCGCDKMNDSIVSLISQLYHIDTELIKKALPLNLIYVSRTVHETSIDEDNSFFGFCHHETEFSERLFKSNLESHECFLELETL